jgi:hypothetical protein
MSAADWALLAGFQVSQFQNGGHRTWLLPAYHAIAQTGYDVSGLATQAQASAAAASGSLATQLALGTPANGIGNEPMDLPRMSMLNGGAVMPWEAGLALFPNTQDATYQITEHDRGKMLLVTSGTRTHTLPKAGADLIGWTCRVRNRSGNNLTVACDAADAINGGSAGASITIATGSAILTVVCTSATGWEVA